MPLPIDQRLERYLARHDLALELCPVMGEFWYRPGQVLVHAEDYDRVADELGRWGAEEDTPGAGGYGDQRSPVSDQRGSGAELPVRRFRLPPRMSVSGVVRRLRQVADGPEPRVAPNQVLGSGQAWLAGPFDNPVPDDGPGEVAGLPDPAGFSVGVVDTGLVLDRTAGGGFLNQAAGHLEFDAADDDPLDVDPRDGLLDDFTAHGTFVAGIVLQEAPEVTVRMARVLIDGLTDDLEIAAAIARVGGSQVINLSLGGYAMDDVPPLALVEALDGLDPEVVVVAAAGNYERRRPMFPAALKRVIGVGAVDLQRHRGRRLPPRAGFSNFGWWVDACTDGVSVLSNYVDFAEDEATGGLRYDGYARWSGTSFAAPKVAGRIAATAVREGISAQEAAHRVVRAPGLPRVPELGTYVS